MNKLRSLMFATIYVDTVEKLRLLEMWLQLARKHSECDLLLVDSSSMMLPYIPMWVNYYTFADNIGHLSKGGGDGWGRAFSYGLDYSIRKGYDYVVHVEGDSLLRMDVNNVFQEMELSDTKVASIRVSSMPTWPETGLMFFDVNWLCDTSFVTKYDWQHRVKYPEPERVVQNIVGEHLMYLPIHGMRDDFHELTLDNFEDRKLDWLTHAPINIMEKFASCV